MLLGKLVQTAHLLLDCLLDNEQKRSINFPSRKVNERKNICNRTPSRKWYGPSLCGLGLYNYILKKYSSFFIFFLNILFQKGHDNRKWLGQWGGEQAFSSIFTYLRLSKFIGNLVWMFLIFPCFGGMVVAVYFILFYIALLVAIHPGWFLREIAL